MVGSTNGPIGGDITLETKTHHSRCYRPVVVASLTFLSGASISTGRPGDTAEALVRTAWSSAVRGTVYVAGTTVDSAAALLFASSMNANLSPQRRPTTHNDGLPPAPVHQRGEQRGHDPQPCISCHKDNVTPGSRRDARLTERLVVESRIDLLSGASLRNLEQ